MDASLVTSLPLIYSAAEGKQRIATSREECKKCPGGQNEKRKTDNKTNVFQFQNHMRLALIQCFSPFRPFPSATDQCLHCRNPLEEHVWAAWFLLFQHLKKKKVCVSVCALIYLHQTVAESSAFWASKFWLELFPVWWIHPKLLATEGVLNWETNHKNLDSDPTDADMHSYYKDGHVKHLDCILAELGTCLFYGNINTTALH